MIQKLAVSLRLKIGIGEIVMANNACRKLPVGIQSFNKIREEGYLYVDKSDIIWNLANNGRQYNFLIRPRRFGKSVLVDTLQAYFEGRKELFEGLKIMDLEKDWKQYPVIRFDMSRGERLQMKLRHIWIELLMFMNNYMASISNQQIH